MAHVRASGYVQPKGWAATKARILKRDGYQCYLCGDQAVTADHVVPVSQGGGHEDDNLAAICEPCHDTKTEAERRHGHAKAMTKRSTKRDTEPHPGKLR